MTKIELTRRRALGGIVTIGAAAAAAGAGTFALFSDTVESTGNTLSAGTLDLQLGTSTNITFSGTDIKPTETGSTEADLQKNSSSTVPGDLSIRVPNVTSSEGDTVPAETNTDTSDDGELDDQLELKLWIGKGGDSDSTFDSGTDIGLKSNGDFTTSNDGGYEKANEYANTRWENVISDFSGPITFNVDWNFPDMDSNNAAQGDDITVDFEFTLTQQ